MELLAYYRVRTGPAPKAQGPRTRKGPRPPDGDGPRNPDIDPDGLAFFAGGG